MKSELRKKTLHEMKSLKRGEKHRMDAVLTELLLAHPFYREAKIIATYLPFPHEFQTIQLIKQAQRDGKQVVIPKTYPKGRMEFVSYEPQQLARTSFGLLEPQGDLTVVNPCQIDLVHVPGLVFTHDGYRIGYGAGYYDRYLAGFKGKTISSIYPCQLQEFIPKAHDVPVQEVLIYEDTV